MKKTLSLAMIVLLTLSCNQDRSNQSQALSNHDSIEIETDIVEVATLIPPTPIINVYVENSGSMDGYVKGVTEFEQSVYNFLSDIKIKNLTSELNLNYINSTIIPQNSDIQDFIEKLEPSTFKAKGGKRSTSDISNVFKSILSKTNDSILSILVSDCVFSPGSGVNAGEYLVNQQIGIKVSMSEYLQAHPQTAVLIYQLSSKFNGKYYNRLNQPTQINNKRPFYIWVIGHQEYIRALINQIKNESFKGSGIENSYILSSGHQSIKYDVPMGYGNFTYDKKIQPPTHNLAKMRKDQHTGKAMFSINVDFSPLLVSDGYIKDISNYNTNDTDYKIESIASTAAIGYTHNIKISSPVLKPCQYQISLMKSLPQWVYDLNSDDDMDINSYNNMNKTYGIKYLIEGVNEAYLNESKFYSTLQINIKTN